MERVVKFRAKNKESGIWYYGSLKPDMFEPHEVSLSLFWEYFESGILDPKTLGEFVEFTNYDGSKGSGFEGDIISHGGDNHNGVIRFKDGEFYVGEGAKDIDGFLRRHGLPPSTLTVKIIGNVIDNPKLKYRWGRS